MSRGTKRSKGPGFEASLRRLEEIVAALEEGDRPLEIPAGAVVVPGTRPVRSGAGREAGIGLYTPVIVKYRDEKTDTAVRLEELLR